MRHRHRQVDSFLLLRTVRPVRVRAIFQWSRRNTETNPQSLHRHIDCFEAGSKRVASRYVMPMANSRRPFAVFPYVVVLFVILPGLCFCLLGLLELLLEREHVKQWAELSKQFKPYYWWHFVTHDGRDLGYEHKGPLKLALHPFAIYSNLPNQHSDHFSTDDHGFRGSGRDRPLDTHARVVLVGGSTAFGTGLESDRETVASQLAQSLNAEVINAAVIGHGSGQELTYLLTELVDLHPDVVIALDGWNDYYKRLEVSDPRLLGMNGFDQIEDQLVASAQLSDSSLLTRLYSLPRTLFPRLTSRVRYSRIGLWAGWVTREELQPQSLDLAATRYADNLIKMHKLGRAFDFQFLAVMQPDVNRGTDYQRFRARTESLLVREGVRVLNLGNCTEFLPSMFLDTMHLDGTGHGLMADLIAQTIQSEHLLASARATMVPEAIR